MTYQRRRGETITVWLSAQTTDNRGNKVNAVDETIPPFTVRAWVIPQRSSKAEVPGQQIIEVVRLGIGLEAKDIDLWGQVEYRGERWDIAAPPAFHNGSRHVRHYSIDIRKRPS